MTELRRAVAAIRSKRGWMEENSRGFTWMSGSVMKCLSLWMWSRGAIGCGLGVSRRPPFRSSRENSSSRRNCTRIPCRAERVNTRTKDLIDMLLLIEQGNLDNRRVASAIATTFEKRATHDVPRKLEPPPAEWKPTFEALAGNVVSRRICRTALRRCKGSSPGLANDDDRKRHGTKPQG